MATNKPKPTKPQGRVSRFSIGRLYNLGNYEHVRYEVTIDIPEGASAADAALAISQILRRLKPVSEEMRRAGLQAERFLATPRAQLKERMESAEITRRQVAARETIQKYKAAKQRCESAWLAFDNLGGVEIHKDAKEDWDDGDEFQPLADEDIRPESRRQRGHAWRVYRVP